LIFLLSSLAAKAMPIACDKPEPKGPEVVSIPANDPLWGWPCNLEFNFLKE